MKRNVYSDSDARESTTGGWVTYSDHKAAIKKAQAEAYAKGLQDFEVARDAAIAKAVAEKDGAYLERNQLVAALSKLFPAGVARTAIEGWSEDWHGCVYIDLPTGQVSWHFHDSQAHLFAHLPTYQGKWDGHDTPEKYRRLAAIRTAP
jgi:hypothetical protein